MKIRNYLSEKAVTLCFLAIGALVMAVFMAAAGLEAKLLLISELLFILMTAIWLFTGYYVEAKKVKKLRELACAVERQYLIGEVIKKPRGLVEREYYDIMKTVSKSAIGIAQSAIKDKEEYCDYVESWIHEIKTPLTACSLILSNGADEKKLRKELKNADNLTESILYYARMRSAHKDIKIRKVNVKKVADDAVTSQLELLMSAKISVNVEGDFTVHTDDKSLLFILKQLLINCAKYCPGCHIDIVAKDGQISVRDDGIGIYDYEIKRVTERAFTGTNGRNLGSSTGMGLYIVNELCKNMDIDLKIESVRGEYTKVTLSFRALTKS